MFCSFVLFARLCGHASHPIHRKRHRSPEKARENSTKIREMFQASALFCDDFLEQHGTH
jgi:hypothetical protein